jgi:Bacitracin resistance protein BacA
VDTVLLLKAALMGVVEGLTEFLPISSTGHLILAGALLGFDDDKAKVFDIAIQTGAIFAVVLVYWQKIKNTLVALPSQKEAQAFALNVLIAFLPAVVLGLLFGKTIKAHLFTPIVVASTFIIGGFIILWAEKRQQNAATAPRILDVDAMGKMDALKVGLIQGHDPRHQPQRGHHHWRHVAGFEPQSRHRFFVLPGHSHTHWRGGLQPVQRTCVALNGRFADVFGGPGGVVHQRLVLREVVA